MIINGKQIASDIKAELKARVEKLSQEPRFDIIYAGSDPAIESFLKIKIKAGTEIGVLTVVHRFPADVSEAELLEEIASLAAFEYSTAMIVQLPLPSHLNAKTILDAVPSAKDADVLSEQAFKDFEEKKITAVPPVAAAMMEVLARNNISMHGKNAVVLGRGALVGKPIKICLEQAGANVTVLNSQTGDPTEYLQKADIIATGIGKPHYIKPEMIREGAVLLDGGTTGSTDGRVEGDADPACAEKCAIFTPTPGGIGPVTVAMLFKNVVEIAERKVPSA